MSRITTQEVKHQIDTHEAVCVAVHTDAIISAYQEHIANKGTI